MQRHLRVGRHLPLPSRRYAHFGSNGVVEVLDVNPVATPPFAQGSANTKEESAVRQKEEEGRQVIDRLSKQCRRVSDEYGLSTRETEVMELLGRGRSGPAIADELFISENTVRTHIKRIYAKVGVSKKQELLEILERTSPS